MENDKGSVEGLETVSFKISGICSCESKIIEKKMKNLEGVKSYSLNFVTNQLKVTFDRSLVTIEAIQKAVSKAGAKAVLLKSDQIL